MTATPRPRTTSLRRRVATLERRITTADAPARHLTEAQFRKQVTDLLTLYRWRWVYFPDSRMIQGSRGVPDIIAIRRADRRIVHLELKTMTGRLSANQRAWIDDINNVPGNVVAWVVRPNDLDSLERLLA